MTTPFNVASDYAQVGIQSETTIIETVVLPGDVQLTIGEDAMPLSVN